MPKKITVEIEEKQDELIRNARSCISNMQKLLSQIDSALKESKVFPYYIIDFSAAARSLAHYQMQHNILTTLSHAILLKRRVDKRPSRG